MFHLLRFFLRNFPVLAVQTPEVAAGGGDGKGAAAGMKVGQGFFFNGVQMDGTGVSVGQGVEFPPDIDLGAANAPIPGSQDAVVGAYLALHVLAIRCIMKAFNGPLPWDIRRIVFRDVPFDAARAVGPFPQKPIPRPGTQKG